MAVITGLTAERMLEIEAASVVDGDVVGDHLILSKHDGSTIDAGNVRGPTGADGPPGSLTRVTALPGSPANGAEILFVADAANGVVWHLKYNAGSSSAYKWEFVGGGDLSVEVPASQNYAPGTGNYGDAATAVSLTAPLAGDYKLSHGADLIASSTQNLINYASLKLGGAATSDNEAAAHWSDVGAANNVGASLYKSFKRTLTAGMVVKQQYKISWGSGGPYTLVVQKRFIEARPVRVG